MKETIEPEADTAVTTTTGTPAPAYQFEKPSLTFGNLRDQE